MLRHSSCDEPNVIRPSLSTIIHWLQYVPYVWETGPAGLTIRKVQHDLAIFNEKSTRTLPIDCSHLHPQRTLYTRVHLKLDKLRPRCTVNDKINYHAWRGPVDEWKILENALDALVFIASFRTYAEVLSRGRPSF
jgi:hypothetical protein